ncbi:MAG: endonuclease III [Verrucomicrobia bacterium]|jgi:endonuclease III|nr:endonuclease III [Verrucomicrobiota bacterium]
MKPEDIPAVHRALKREYEKHDAPIIEFIQAQTGSPFKVLVATILSARTKDETTTQVVRKLFKVVQSPDDLRKVSFEELEKLLFPVGFFRVKARHLKALPDVLDGTFGGKIPETIDELCKLPGVGRKTANLVVTVAFDKHGICVDVHVHRITNRLGLISTKTPLETEMALRECLPKRYWKSWNRQLVSFGQTLCKPQRPECSRCPITQFCDSANT